MIILLLNDDTKFKQIKRNLAEKKKKKFNRKNTVFRKSIYPI